MACKTIRHRLDALLDGELTVAEVERVTAHLGVCRECRQTLKAQRQIAAALDRLPAMPAPSGVACSMFLASPALAAARPNEKSTAAITLDSGRLEPVRSAKAKRCPSTDVRMQDPAALRRMKRQ